MNFELGCYREPLQKSCQSRLLRLERADAGIWLYPEQSCFFPEGGGQPGDRGVLHCTLEGKERRYPIVDTQLRVGQLALLLPAEAQLPAPGAEISMELDWPRRWSYMRLHSAEHMLSGYVRQRWGYQNVGFALYEGRATADFDGLLTEGDCREIEQVLQRRIWENHPIHAWIAGAEELETQDFRQKKAIEGPLRLVQVEDCDCCACCALHCTRTGEIGAFAIQRLERQRRGTRLHILVGEEALTQWQLASKRNLEISRHLSLPQEEILAGLEQQEARLREAQQGRRQLLLSLAQQQVSGLERATVESSATGPETAMLPDSLAELPRQVLAQLVQGLDKTDLQPYVQELVAASGWVALLLSHQGERGTAFYLAGPEGSECQLAALVQKGRDSGLLLGGGRDCYYQGKCQLGAGLEPQDYQRKIKEDLELEPCWLAALYLE